MPGSRPFLHSFCKQRLFDLSHKIFVEDEQILLPFSKKGYKIWDLKPLRTIIKSNSELMEEGEIKNITSYDDLNRMGWMIVSEKVDTRYFRGQSVEYKLKRYNKHVPHLQNIPNNHDVQYDELNERIRLKGRNAGPLGVGKWHFINPRGVSKKENYLNIIDDTQQIKRRLLSRYMQIEETPDIINIPEIPVMISVRGELVCIPKNPRDEPVIAICGGRGCSYSPVITNKGIFTAREVLEDPETIVGAFTYSVDENGKTTPSKILEVIDSGTKEVFDIKTKSGRHIKVTSNHNMLVRSGQEIVEKRAENLKKGDFLPIDRSGREVLYTEKDGFKLDKDFGWLCGLYLAEGHVSKYEREEDKLHDYSIGFTFSDNVIASKLKPVLEKYGCHYYEQERKEGLIHRIVVTNGKSTNLHNFMMSNFKTGSSEKEIPTWVDFSPIEFKKGLLSGYMTGDGSVHRDGTRVTWCSVSKKLRDGIDRLFRQFGIVSTLSDKDKSYDRHKGINSNDAYRGEIPCYYHNYLETIISFDDKRKGDLFKNRDKTRAEVFFENVIDVAVAISEEALTQEQISEKTNIDRSRVSYILNKHLFCEKEKRTNYTSQEFEQTTPSHKLTLLKECKKGSLQKKICNLIKKGIDDSGDIRTALEKEHDYRNIYRAMWNMEDKGIIKRKEYMKPVIKKRKSRSVLTYYKLKSDDVYFDEIKSITSLGDKRVYDLKIESPNTFLTDEGVFIHNSGKTLMAHSIIDHVYWKRNKQRIVILNDSLQQTQTWTLPCDRHPDVAHVREKQRNIFVRGIKKIGEHPMPLPLIFLYPNTETLRDLVFPKEEISFRTSLPFEHVIQNYSYFLKGKSEWKLGKSAPYFRNIKEEVIKCSNLDEIEEILNVAVEEEKLNKQSKDKIFAVIIDMFNQRILDVNTGVPAYWEVQKKGENQRKKLNPVLAAMEAGIIPVIMTQNLLSKDYFPQYMRYFIDSIFEYQIDVAKYRNEPTWIFIDEMPDISSTETKTVAAESLRRCVTEGRNPKIGTIYALQNWTKVERQIRNNTTHLFAYHNKSRETREIAKDFDLPSHIEKDIITLDKFRLIGMTHEKFIVYTPEGERYETSDPIKGKAIMPLSQHQKPGG